MRDCLKQDEEENPGTQVEVFILRKKFLPEKKKVIGGWYFSTYPFVFNEKP
jgi:hypothetical protein